MSTGPCKDCTDRYIACHDFCEKYIEWRQEFDATKERIFKQRMNEKMLDERRNKSIARMKHYKKNNACTCM